MAVSKLPAISGPVCENMKFEKVNPHILGSPFSRAFRQPLTQVLRHPR